MNTETEVQADQEQVMTATEAAAFLKMSPDYVYTAAADGRLPSVKMGRNVRFLRSSLVEHMKRQERGGK